MSLGGSKDIKITEEYSLPVFGSFIYNPDSEAAFLSIWNELLIKLGIIRT
jgi:hypothetical protein